MRGRMTNKNAAKVTSIALSVCMALSPMVAYADELLDTETNLSAQAESENTAAEAESINVEEALNMIDEMMGDGITDEATANEIEAAADALLSLYDAQSSEALDALAAISEEANAVTLLEDGSVSVDWDAADAEKQDLSDAYQGLLEEKEAAESAMNAAIEDKNNALSAIEALNEKISANDEKLSEVKLNKNDEINAIIDTIAAEKGKTLTIGQQIDTTLEENDDKYRFNVNTIKDGIVYGCLTYYDSANNIILRKNFSISAEGDVDHEYVPKPEWVREDKNVQEVIFGNGGNYLAAYAKANSFSSSTIFNGQNVSTLMRNNAELNNTIDARNEALTQLVDYEAAVAEAESNLEDAKNNAQTALDEYNEIVAKYESVASLEEKITNTELEKARLEYVKAEIEKFRNQQVLNQINNTINADTAETENTANTVVSTETTETLETVINDIANNLGVDTETAEDLVNQAIADTTYTDVPVANYEEPAAVENIAVEAAEIQTPNVPENTNVAAAANNEVPAVAADVRIVEVEEAGAVEEAENATVAAAREVVTIEDNKTPLAYFGNDADVVVNNDATNNNSANWWLPLIIALSIATGIILIVVKKNQKEEAN